MDSHLSAGPISRTSPATRGRVFAYARWQFLDYLHDRSLAIFAIGILIGFPLVASIRAMGASEPAHDVLLQGMIAQGLSLLVSQLAPIYTLITINKIVSGDRSNGYYRFLFAKPISVPRYYAQLFIVNGIGMTLVLALLCGVAHLFSAPLPVLQLLAVFATTYIAMGGIGFLFSVLMRFDWQPMMALWYASSLFLYPRYSDSGDFREALVHIFPPAHLFSSVTASILTEKPLVVSHFAWLVAYGLACFLAGIVATRYRQLAS